jgi:hypothetical protein
LSQYEIDDFFGLLALNGIVDVLKFSKGFEGLLSGLVGIFLCLDFEPDSFEMFFHFLEVLSWNLVKLFVSVLRVRPFEPTEFLKTQSVE